MSETIIKNPPWWNRRSTLERSLLAIIGLLMILAIVLAIIILLLIFTRIQARICTTTSCVEASAQLLKRMKPDVNPCENFYEFACGNFANNIEIPKTRTSVTSLSIIEDKMEEQIRKVLEEPITVQTKAFTLGKKFYEVCKNLTKIEEQGFDPIKKILNTLGGWPILEGNKWNETNFDWKELNYKLRKIGFDFSYLFTIYVHTDTKNPKKRTLYLAQASLEIPQELLLVDLNHKIMKAYYEFMIDVALILGVNKTIAEEELMDALLFQRKLGEISLSQIELRNASALYNPMSIEDLQKMHPTIPWLKYINNILNPIQQVKNSEIIINQTPLFISNLEKLLQETPKKTIANYILWQIVKYAINALPDDFQKAQLKFLHAAAGVTEMNPRWKRCVSKVQTNFDLIVGALYVRKYFNKESKNKALEIVGDIRKVFKETLNEIDWMDDQTKKSALEKVDAMDTHVAYPNELLDDEKLDKYYEKLEINENSFLESSLLINKWAYDHSYSELRKTVNRSDWTEHGDVAKAGAFYVPTENSIILPAGILQGDFFSINRPNYMNYGSIGFTIGHEITHGFDNEGRQYDKEGIVFDWWNPKIEKAFLKKAQCIIDQYNKYTVREINETINGVLTEGENIADNGGIKQAYLAYKKWLQRNQYQEEHQLPGLQYTSSQMFWISMASTWCSKDRLDHLRLLLQSDPHAPNPFRVIGSITNQPEFAKDFNCPVGSKMNPEQKCQVW